MSYSRYNKNPFIQPIKKIKPANTDIIHTFKMGENIDNLAELYYSNSTYGWIIMLGNRQYPFEFAVPFGAQLRIPFPLERVFRSWGVSEDN